jgi:hypothetical protein
MVIHNETHFDLHGIYRYDINFRSDKQTRKS